MRRQTRFQFFARISSRAVVDYSDSSAHKGANFAAKVKRRLFMKIWYQNLSKYKLYYKLKIWTKRYDEAELLSTSASSFNLEDTKALNVIFDGSEDSKCGSWSR
ncbi:10807_t:CDS:2 [Paraglomus occultum]|uniref:10807_t:CDS:1 n=1 Tax=Paraglomus occultum TaxID=144539 RepID=A0A9N9BWQ2_9GLOM|nr:10807_t:CDS:2 [Paraglomus occultum]